MLCRSLEFGPFGICEATSVGTDESAHSHDERNEGTAILQEILWANWGKGSTMFRAKVQNRRFCLVYPYILANSRSLPQLWISSSFYCSSVRKHLKVTLASSLHSLPAVPESFPRCCALYEPTKPQLPGSDLYNPIQLYKSRHTKDHEHRIPFGRTRAGGASACLSDKASHHSYCLSGFGECFQAGQVLCRTESSFGLVSNDTLSTVHDIYTYRHYIDNISTVYVSFD